MPLCGPQVSRLTTKHPEDQPPTSDITQEAGTQSEQEAVDENGRGREGLGREGTRSSRQSSPELDGASWLQLGTPNADSGPTLPSWEPEDPSEDDWGFPLFD